MAWKIDSSHSAIRFSVRHMMVANVHGEFKKFEGEIEFDEQDAAASTVDVKIDARSIDTREPQRDAHLRSADFFDAEKYPHLSFRSKSVEMVNDNRARILGDLTIRDVTKPVTLEAEYSGQAKNPYGRIVAGFNALARINRKDWGLTWNVALETGGFLVGDEIAINIELELVKEPVAEGETALA